MSLVQTFLGAGAIAAVAQVLWSTVGFAPPPIVIHSLTYHEGRITQDRTVNKPTWVAKWEAAIVSDISGDPVPNCEGEGFWPYPGGRLAPTMSVGEWVGNPLCDLPPGKYYPLAIYWDGESKIVYRGQPFEEPE